MNKATFLQRSAAWLIDQAILAIIYLLASLAVGGFSAVYENSTIRLSGVLVSLGLGVAILVSASGHFLYFGYFWSRRERSIGMGIMDIKVVKTDGQPLSFLMAGLRGSLGYYISALIFGIGYLWFFVDQKQETWHDKIFDTVVLNG
jgi:uncharacterized RDD family membrane protein YckC